jgi:hypothetical protein
MPCMAGNSFRAEYIINTKCCLADKGAVVYVALPGGDGTNLAQAAVRIGLA